MPPSTTNALDEVFQFLTIAEKLEKKDRIEAATKYYEAVYLMRRHMDHLPVDGNSTQKVKRLLMEKADHYEQVASKLMIDDVSVLSDGISALTMSPRSPLTTASNYSQPSQQQFFQEEPNLMPAKQVESGKSLLSSSSSSTIDHAAGQANMKLAQALDLDENGKINPAIKAYMDAAELYLAAIQMCPKQKKLSATPVQNVLKRRLEQTLDRVEELKHPNAHLSDQRKASTSQSSQQSQALTPEEIDVLKRSSMIASGMFLPWIDQDAQDLASQCTGPQSHLFTDPDGLLPLSEKQQERLHAWARPSEILRIRQQNAVLGSILKPSNGTPCIVKAITPYTILQKYVTDCSFIASLCICATFERRFRKRLITSILYPQDAEGNLVYNPAGKYMVKLWLNGVARCVVIDDKLPIDRNGNLLCSQTTHSSENSLELWVCLIEKAYMKLCGGYNFPGSNSGVDLFSLTGWIPERVMFAKNPEKVRDYETPTERAWERIFSASSYGDCLITVSTQMELTEDEADKVGLVTGHAYAVLAVIETRSGTRLLQLKNPWAHKGWKGRYSSGDSTGWRSQAFCHEVGYDPIAASKQDDGVFWICWEDILKYFQNFHLSWNPALFRKRLEVHGTWPETQGPADDTFNIGENPQYTLTMSETAIKKKATVWILISRHVTRQEQAGSDAKDYLTVHIHRNDGKKERIYYPGRAGNCVLTGCYTNNPHVLVRYDISDASDQNLSLVLSQYKKSNDLNYTLSCFCTEEFELGKPQRELLQRNEVSSTWSTYTAGGPIGSPKFSKNPQFSVCVPSDAAMQLSVATTTTIAVNVLLVPVKRLGEKIEQNTGEPVLDSGKYRHGFVVTEKNVVKAGNYTAIVSNFHPDQTGLFSLKVASSSNNIQIQKIGR